jgi:hypothetical protein
MTNRDEAVLEATPGAKPSAATTSRLVLLHTTIIVVVRILHLLTCVYGGASMAGDSTMINEMVMSA